MDIISELVKLLSIIAFVVIALRLIYGLLSEVGIIPARKEDNSEIGGSKGVNKIREDDLEILKTVACLAIFSRLFIYLLGYICIMFFKGEELGFFNTFKSIWLKWDSYHYLNIAENWYQGSGKDRFLIVYLPLYPLLIKLSYFFLRDYFLSGILVSNICLILSCFYLYKLTRIDFDNKISFNAVKYMLFFPFSFFLGLAFSESLFMALSIITFYHIRKKNWFLCGIFGLLSSLTRSLGVLLLIPAIIEFLLTNKVIENIRNKDGNAIIENLRRFSCLLLMPMGFGLYLFLNRLVTGDWFKFTAYYKENWHTGLGFFANNLKEVFESVNLSTVYMKLPIWFPVLVLYILIFLLIFYSFNKIKLSYRAYMSAYFFVVTSITWAVSACRYITVLFPIYILFALISRNPVLDFILTFISLTFLCFYVLAFTYGNLVL